MFEDLSDFYIMQILCRKLFKAEIWQCESHAQKQLCLKIRVECWFSQEVPKQILRERERESTNMTTNRTYQTVFAFHSGIERWHIKLLHKVLQDRDVHFVLHHLQNAKAKSSMLNTELLLTRVRLVASNALQSQQRQLIG